MTSVVTKPEVKTLLPEESEPPDVCRVITDQFISRNEHKISFYDEHDEGNLYNEICCYKLPRQKPGKLCRVSGTTLAYADSSQDSCRVHFLDCSDVLPKSDNIR